MRTKIYYCLVFVVLLSCNVLTPDVKFLPGQSDATILHKVKYISHNSTELLVEIEIIVLNSFYQGFDNNYLFKEDFQINGEGMYAIESFDFVKMNAPEAPSSLVFLIDQSGSYLEIDRYNSRTQVFHKFLEDIVAPDEFLLGAYSKGGQLFQEPVEFFLQDFGNAQPAHRVYLFELSKRTGGSCSLLEAADKAVDRLIAESNQTRKELVVMVHENVDDSGLITFDDLIFKASINNIAIHVIVFGDPADKDFFSQLSAETGGMFSVCPTEMEVIKVFSELERLINKQKDVYRLQVNIKPDSPDDMRPGAVSSHRVEIYDPYTEREYVPLYLNIKIPG